MMAVKRAKIIVTGTVQGVFFRDYAKAEALKLGLSGWVKNLKNGKSVETVIEGDYKEVVLMIKWLKKGSPGSVVTGIEIKEERPTGDTAAFNIRF
ncbi:MAG: acylphosphatase [Thermodesulfobacteriota bacterium]